MFGRAGAMLCGGECLHGPAVIPAAFERESSRRADIDSRLRHSGMTVSQVLDFYRDVSGHSAREKANRDVPTPAWYILRLRPDKIRRDSAQDVCFFGYFCQTKKPRHPESLSSRGRCLVLEMNRSYLGSPEFSSSVTVLRMMPCART